MGIRQSEQITEFAAAFVKAQAKFGKALKDTANPFFKSKYADFSAVIDATLEHLNAEDIGVMQHPMLEYKTVGDGVEAYVTVTTRLQHKSGQWEESDLSIPAMMGNKFDAQSVGSAISYACRYAARSICFVPTADDDGNAATWRGSKEAAQGLVPAKKAELVEKILQRTDAPGARASALLNQDVSRVEPEPAQLTVVQTGEDKYEITGDPNVMTMHREALLAYGKPLRDAKNRPVVPPSVIMTGESLNAFRHIFEEQRHGQLVALKATWAKGGPVNPPELLMDGHPVRKP